MATLRDLRKQAKELGITYEKETKPAELEEMIAVKMCEMETNTPAPTGRTPVTAPEPEAPPVESSGDTDPGERIGFAFEVEINDQDLNNEFKTQAAKFARYAEMEAQAKAKLMAAKLRLEVVDSEMSKKFREKFQSEGTKPTEKMIQSEVLVSKQYQVAHQALINATRDVDLARAAKEAFMQRKDMLIQLGSTRRLEMEQIGMNIKERVKEVIGKAA